MNLGESDWLLIQKGMWQSSKKARISGFRLWIIPELSILLLKIAGSGYEIASVLPQSSSVLQFSHNKFCILIHYQPIIKWRPNNSILASFSPLWPRKNVRPFDFFLASFYFKQKIYLTIIRRIKTETKSTNQP